MDMNQIVGVVTSYWGTVMKGHVGSESPSTIILGDRFAKLSGALLDDDNWLLD